jgi:hypothetical protein
MYKPIMALPLFKYGLLNKHRYLTATATHPTARPLNVPHQLITLVVDLKQDPVLLQDFQSGPRRPHELILIWLCGLTVVASFHQLPGITFAIFGIAAPPLIAYGSPTIDVQ